MPDKKKTVMSDGKLMHYSVGMVIERDGMYLLVNRLKEPLGFACPAGHIDEGETPEEAMKREIREETGLEVTSGLLLTERQVVWNHCLTGDLHYWYLYGVIIAPGNPVLNNSEAKSIGWYSPEEIRRLKLEPVWRFWFIKLGIL